MTSITRLDIVRLLKENSTSFFYSEDTINKAIEFIFGETLTISNLYTLSITIVIIIITIDKYLKFLKPRNRNFIKCTILHYKNNCKKYSNYLRDFKDTLNKKILFSDLLQPARKNRQFFDCSNRTQQRRTKDMIENNSFGLLRNVG